MFSTAGASLAVTVFPGTPRQQQFGDGHCHCLVHSVFGKQPDGHEGFRSPLTCSLQLTPSSSVLHHMADLPDQPQLRSGFLN